MTRLRGWSGYSSTTEPRKDPRLCHLELTRFGGRFSEQVSEENFAKVQVGMSEQEVVGILGSPTESDSVTILGVSGTAWQWKSGNAVASVQFVNGKVTSKIWEKPSGAQGGGTRSGY